MGKRNANPREGDADIVARVLAEAGEAELWWNADWCECAHFASLFGPR